MQFGSETYRRGALERIREAEVLFRAGQFVGSMYLAGLAVEAYLRSLVWLRDRRFDERHVLRRIAVRVEDLGLLRPDRRDHDFVATVGNVARRWHNNLRFAGESQVIRWYQEIGLLGRKRPRILKKLCAESFEECSKIIMRCEVLWHRFRKKS